MATIASTRIKKELRDWNTANVAEDTHMKLELVNDSWRELRGEIFGPNKTPYEGGVFALEILVPETYPFVPPKVKFMTKIWHPNISSATGAICLDILKNEWAAAMTLRTVLLSIQALLDAPFPDDPQDNVVAQQYKNNWTVYKLTAQYWTAVHAAGPYSVPEYVTNVNELNEMGVDFELARVTLSQFDWDVIRAAHHLFGDSK